MERLMIVNGSPRAPKSNSKKYSQMFRQFWQGETKEYLVTSGKHEECCRQLKDYDQLMFVFPLYADGIPVTLMNYLKVLEQNIPEKKPVVHVLINCGFFEPEQNLTAVEMMRCFCEKNGFRYGMTFCIGSGEAILTTPFAFFVKRKMKRFVRGMQSGKSELLKVTMPLTKKMFLSASTSYWEAYGAKNGISREEMDTMKIEDHTKER